MTDDQKLAALESAGPFALVDLDTRRTLARSLQPLLVRFGEEVFAAGDPGDALYIITSGKARVVGTNDAGEAVTLNVLGAGECFGELALLTDGPRSATVRAADDLVLLRLGRAEFLRAVGKNEDLEAALRRYLDDTGIRDFLKRFTALGTIPAHALRSLVAELEELSVPAGKVVVKQGESGERFYIVRRGVLEVRMRSSDEADVHIGYVGEGEFFGELSLLTEAPRTATVTAESDCELLALSRRGFERAVATSPDFRARLKERAETYRDELGAAAAPGDDDEAAKKAPLTVTYETAEDADEGGARTIRAPWRRRFLKRYPHVVQHDETDCGAACLAMLTRYYDVPVGVSRLRDLANVDSDGASMWSVAEAAEELGFHARGLYLSYGALRKITLPAIVHWQGYHYILLYEAHEDHVVVGDPATSLKKMPVEEFRRGWTGRALELTATERLRDTEPMTTSFARLKNAMRSEAGLVGEVMMASLVLNVLGLGMPLFTQILLDRVLVNRSIDLLNVMLGAMVMVSVFSAATTACRRLLVVHIASRTDARMLGDYFRHVMALPMRFFDLRRVGDVVSRVSENNKIRNAMVGIIPGLVLDTTLATGYLALMAYYNIKLTMLVLAVTPLFAMLMFTITPPIRRNRLDGFARRTDAWSFLIESMTAVSTIKAMAAETSVRWRMESLFADSIVVDRKGAHLNNVYWTTAEFLRMTSGVLFLWFGARQVIGNAMTTGQLLAFTTLAANVIGPIMRLIAAWDQMQEVRNAVERLNDVFDARAEQASAGPRIKLAQLRGNIEFDNVMFKYTRSQDKPTLEGINLKIEPGETIAIVGRSGSGKSTLAKLILGLYPASRGRVLIDGHDIRTLHLQSLRRRVGVVPQEVFLFSGTIRDNIAMSDPEAPLRKVVEASKMAGAHSFICEMGMGYDTKVGERGMSLSGGQRQRIALARALIGSPSILLLDEATAALDNESERAIQQNLESAAAERTTIVVAHRLSTIKNADRILVLDSGNIVEMGDHESLVAEGGLYASLVGQQVSEG